jgi:hypothetical protein
MILSPPTTTGHRVSGLVALYAAAACHAPGAHLERGRGSWRVWSSDLASVARGSSGILSCWLSLLRVNEWVRLARFLGLPLLGLRSHSVESQFVVLLTLVLRNGICLAESEVQERQLRPTPASTRDGLKSAKLGGNGQQF